MVLLMCESAHAPSQSELGQQGRELLFDPGKRRATTMPQRGGLLLLGAMAEVIPLALWWPWAQLRATPDRSSSPRSSRFRLPLLQPADTRLLFAGADYRRLWAIGGLTGVARWLEFVAVAIFAYELTRSPELVALLAVLRMVPYLLLGFLVGAVADAIDRKRLLVVSFAAMVLASATMFVITATGAATYAAAAAMVMVSGAFWTTDMPVRRRLLVDAIGNERAAVALGFDNATMYATRALGPLLAGVIYQALGISGIYALIAMSYLVCLVLAARVAVCSQTPIAAPSAGGRLSFLLPPRELVLDRRFQIIMGVTLVYNLWCWPFIGMVPVIGQKDFALTPALVGALSACDGIGGTIGAISVGLLAAPRTLFRFYYLGTLTCLVLILGLALNLSVGTAVVILLLTGIAAAAFSSTQYALVHNLAPPEMRGRATGVLSIFIGSSMLGHWHAGLLFERLGSAAAMKVMGCEGLAAMLALAVLWWRTPMNGGLNRPASNPSIGAKIDARSARPARGSDTTNT
jgi:predicted MFS family arabinose efflux permease